MRRPSPRTRRRGRPRRRSCPERTDGRHRGTARSRPGRRRRRGAAPSNSDIRHGSRSQAMFSTSSASRPCRAATALRVSSQPLELGPAAPPPTRIVGVARDRLPTCPPTLDRAEHRGEADRGGPDSRAASRSARGRQHQTRRVGHQAGEHRMDRTPEPRTLFHAASDSAHRRKIGQVEAVLHESEAQLVGDDLRPLVGQGQRLTAKQLLIPSVTLMPQPDRVEAGRPGTSCNAPRIASADGRRQARTGGRGRGRRPRAGAASA